MKKYVIFGFLFLWVCFTQAKEESASNSGKAQSSQGKSDVQTLGTPNLPVTARKAYFAGGCFWCMESPFEKEKGVSSVISGFMGGHVKNPTYEQVTEGNTGHIETVEVNYNPQVITYERLLEIYWRQIDPTDPNGQFVDQGESYKSVIFYNDESERKRAEESKVKLDLSKKFKKPIVTEIKAASVFYPAEDYHQDYYKKNPIRYNYYRSRSGRDDFLNKYWK